MKMYVLWLFWVCFCLPVWAGGYNIASKAQVTASSFVSDEYSPPSIIDGIIGVDGKGEWASKGKINYWGQCKFPWVKLSWNEKHWINRIVLYDRVNEYDHIAAIVLEASNGYSKSFHGIPNNGTPFVIDLPNMEVEWLNFRVIDGDGKDLGFSEIEVFPSPEGYEDWVSWVNPFVETIPTRFFYFITGNQPYGMIGAAPVTRNKNQGGGGYNYNSTQILGFGQLHCWMQSGLNIMPTAGQVDPRKGMLEWLSTFNHDSEIAQPGFHRLFLDKYKMWVEQTATDRASFYRFRFTQNGDAGIILGLGGKLGSVVMKDYQAQAVSATEIAGSFTTTDRLWGGPQNAKVYFVVRFDTPFDTVKAWDGDVWLNNNEIYMGENGGVLLKYSNVKAGETLQLKAAVSFTSIENARNNMNQSCSSWDFDKVRKESQTEWNEWLGKIEVKGGRNDQKIKFYTNLWHVLLGRHKINDYSGDYPDLTQGTKSLTGRRAEFKYIADSLLSGEILP